MIVHRAPPQKCLIDKQHPTYMMPKGPQLKFAHVPVHVAAASSRRSVPIVILLKCSDRHESEQGGLQHRHEHDDRQVPVKG